MRFLIPRHLQTLALMMGIVSIMTVFECQSGEVQSRFGSDIQTVVSHRSASESFTTAGTYRLHEHAFIAPECDQCQPPEPAMDQHLPPVTNHVYDFHERVTPQDLANIHLASLHGNPLPIHHDAVPGLMPKPSTPPPQR